MLPPTSLAALLREFRDRSQPAISDADLLARFTRTADPKAFALLVRRHGPLVRAVCRRQLIQPADVYDVLQAVFMVLARKAHRLARPAALAAWLHGVAYRLAQRARVDAARRQRHETSRARPETGGALNDLTARELLAVLDAELHRLPEQERYPLICCYLHGKSQGETAAELGISRGTLYHRLERGRERLRRRLEKRGLELPAVMLPLMPRVPELESALVSETVQAVLGSGARRLGAMMLAGTFAERLLMRFKVLLSVGVLTTLAGLGLALAERAGTPTAGPTAGVVQAPAEPKPLLDLHGDPLPPGAVCRLGTLRWKSRGWVDCLSISRDGKTLAAAINYPDFNCIELRDATDGQLLRTLQGHGKRIGVVALAPDGKTLISGSEDKTISQWDVATGRLIRTLEGHTEEVRTLSYSVDGKRIYSCGLDRKIRSWDAANGRLLTTLEGHNDWVSRLACCPDGKTMISGGYDKTLRLWDLTTGMPVRTMEGLESVVRAVAISADGRLAASACINSVQLWDAATGALIRNLEGNLHAVNSLEFSADGKTLATGNDEGIVGLWEVSTGKPVHRMKTHTSPVHSVVFSPDGKRLFSGSSDRTILLWETATGNRLDDSGHTDDVLNAVFSPDGRKIATCGHDNTIRLWETETGKLLKTLRGEGGNYVSSVVFSPDGKMLASDGKPYRIRLWNVDGDKPIETLGSVYSNSPLAWSPDGKMLAFDSWTDKGFSTRLVDPSDGRLLLTIGQTKSTNSLAFSPDGRWLARGEENRIQLWDPTTGKLVHQLQGHTKQIQNVLFSPDSKTLASSSDDQTIRLWNPNTGKPILTLDGHQGEVWGLAFSPTGRILASVSHDNTVRWWAVSGRGELLRTLPVTSKYPGHNYPRTLSWSPDGRTVAVIQGDNTVLLWDRYAPPDQRFPNLDESVYHALFDANGETAYTAMGRLVRSPDQAVELIRCSWRLPNKLPAGEIDQLIAQLDDKRFAVREKARERLKAAGYQAEGPLREVLRNGPSLELQRRVEGLLQEIELRDGRPILLVDLLEQIGSTEAREMLGRLAREGSEACRHEAEASLTRLKLRGER